MKKEWKDENGNLLSTEIIQQISKDWSAAKWEAYLSDLESPQRECLFKSDEAINFFIDPQSLENEQVNSKADETSKTKHSLQMLVDMLKSNKNAKVNSIFYRAIRNLSKNEKKVIIDHFWLGKKYVDIAKELKVSSQTVNTYKKRAIQKLRVNLLPLYEGILEIHSHSVMSDIKNEIAA